MKNYSLASMRVYERQAEHHVAKRYVWLLVGVIAAGLVIKAMLIGAE